MRLNYCSECGAELDDSGEPLAKAGETSGEWDARAWLLEWLKGMGIAWYELFKAPFNGTLPTMAIQLVKDAAGRAASGGQRPDNDEVCSACSHTALEHGSEGRCYWMTPVPKELNSSERTTFHRERCKCDKFVAAPAAAPELSALWEDLKERSTSYCPHCESDWPKHTPEDCPYKALDDALLRKAGGK